MNQEKPTQQTSTLEWMLQSAEVDDGALGSALLYVYYQDLFSFAYLLSGRQPAPAAEAVQAAVAVVVKERHRISLETSLRAWLFTYIYRLCRQTRKPLKVLASRLPFTSYLKTGGAFFLSNELEGLPEKYALSLALNYVYGFSLQEAAAVQKISEKAARDRLIVSRVAAYKRLYPQRLDPGDHLGYLNLLYHELESQYSADRADLQEHLAACPACRAYANNRHSLEERLAGAASVALNEAPVQDLESAARQVLAKTGLSQQPRRRSLPVKEIGLVAVIVVTLALFGNWLELFTPFDAHPTLTLPAVNPTSTLTPTPGPLPPLVLEGVEGVDYFYFTYPVHEVETLETLSEKTGLTQDEIRSLNRIEPGRPAYLRGGREVRLVAFRDSGWFDPPPRSNERLLAPPLTASSSVEEVLERNRESDRYWQTFWAEYVYVNSPIPGVLARPDIVYFFQVWQAGTARGVVAAGGVMEAETYAVFQTGDWSFLTENRGYRGMWDSQGMGMFAPLFGGDITTAFGEIEFQLGQTGTIAGRQAVSLTGSLEDGQFVIWFDALTGIVLGFDFSDAFGEGANLHLFTNRLEYDVLFPPGLFYPPTSPVKGLSASFRGDPVKDASSIPIDWSNFPMPPFIETQQPPPPDLDFASVALLLQRRDDAGSLFEVFAGEYYLGSLELPPNIRACQRSPDGMYAVVTVTSDIIFSESSEHYFIDLEVLEKRLISGPSYGRTANFAFSRDGSRLAYTDCLYPCRLSILNIESAEIARIGRDFSFNDALSLSWSPDGTQIAVLFSGPVDPTISPFFVLDAETGKEFYSGTYHWTAGNFLSPGSPTDDWGVPYPPEEEVLPCDKPVQP